MTADVLGRREGAAVVPLRLVDDDVDLRNEEQHQRHGGAETDRQTHGDHLVLAAEVDRHEGQPDDARRVHGEADELRLVEVLREVARLDGVQRAEDDEEDVEAERHNDAFLRLIADEPDAAARRVHERRVGAIQAEGGADDDALGADDGTRDDHLGGVKCRNK